ncbi:type II toxin-antitoxin system HigA family antitoxin [Deinococcus sp. Marseille-Q6407]|uniref:helix-turn-helix domain-containing protein n=1 Tax=Deinococcus sp. Marseille-Q6407 TaxID=2969223 RepID=UPI0021BE2B47|nr:helix-turn-helix domain-containing protein [Deinococcus sp. Marseille-Q6407]
MTLDISELTVTWQRLHVLAHDAIAPITDEESYDRAIMALDALLKEVGEDETHPLADLVEGLIHRVTAYQEAAQHVPPAAPEMQLRLLIQERGVTQQALSEATGIPQGNISNLIHGKRSFTVAHARTLGDYFGVNPGVFL